MEPPAPAPWIQHALRQARWPLLLALVLAALYGASGGALDRHLFDAADARSSPTVSPDIAIVAIDEASLAQQGSWPWSRDLLAQMVDRLASAGARTIVLALPLEGAQNESGLQSLQRLQSLVDGAPTSADPLRPALVRALAEGRAHLGTDQRLADSLRRAGNVLLLSHMEAAPPAQAPPALHLPPFLHRSAIAGAAPQVLAARSAVPPLDLLGNAAAGAGHLTSLSDAQGVARQTPLLLAADGALIPSLALLAAAHSLHLGPSSLRWTSGQGLLLGPNPAPVDAQALLTPRSYAPAEALDTAGLAQYSAHSLLAGRLPAAHFKDRTVLIGPTGSAAPSLVQRPGGLALPPVQWLAQQISALRQGHVRHTPPWAPALQGLASAVALAVLVLALPSLGIALGAALTTGLALALLALQWGAMQGAGLALPLTLPAALLLLGLLLHLAQNHRPSARPAASPPADPEADRMVALALQGQGQLDMAFARLRKVRGNPQVVDDLLKLAHEFEQKMRFDQAVEVYSHILRRNREHPEARQRRRRARHLAEVAAQASMPMEPGALEHSTQPAQLGRYQVEKELGRGAMGVVYLGRDPTIGRAVAIKTLALGQEFEGSALVDARQRFFREAESAGRLQHQHIVTIYDAGEDQGLAWIAMECLKGQDLAGATQPERLLPAEQVVSIAARVADALDYAHLQNVIHRDIKPANIMYDPADDAVKVSDFGIARITDNSKTRTGLVLGTPSFMAPEQLAGRRIDGRCDLYALGVTLFQLLTGQLPLRGNSMSELMHHIAHSPAPDVRSLRPDLPAALAAAVEQALRKNPQERFQTGRQMAAALRGVYATPQGVSGGLVMPIDLPLDYDGALAPHPAQPMPEMPTIPMDAAAPQLPSSGPTPGAR